MSYVPKKNTAIVEQVEGLYIFTESKPEMEYEYLGTVKRNTCGFGDCGCTGVISIAFRKLFIHSLIMKLANSGEQLPKTKLNNK